MVLKPITTLLVSLVLLGAMSSRSVLATPIQVGPRPTTTVVSDSNPDPGDTISLSVTLDKTWPTDTTVNLASSDTTALPVPSTMTVGAGKLVGSIYLPVPYNRAARSAKGSTAVMLTASTPDGYAVCYVLVND
ncbi:MAG TPA: hypothetical protein VK934_08060 [Fimbriimonas sp.]|nr:hypothetical protein [Fimbriimonas sp.]